MQSSYQTALMLMVIGMFTVFTILFLVVITSKLLIIIINKYFPDTATPEISHLLLNRSYQNKKKVSAIIAAVEALTAGKGKIKEIKKIDKK